MKPQDQDITALSDHLRELPAAGGWLTINRDHLSTSLGIGRVQLARLLKRAESRLGIQLDGDRVKFVAKSNISKSPKKVDLGRILAAASEVVRDFERKSSRN